MFKELWYRILMMFYKEEQYCQVKVLFYVQIIHYKKYIFSELNTKTQNLSMLTEKYKKDATYLNTKSMYVKAAVGGIVCLVVILYFWVL